MSRDRLLQVFKALTLLLIEPAGPPQIRDKAFALLDAVADVLGTDDDDGQIVLPLGEEKP